MTYSDNYNIRTKNVKFNDVADAIDGALTRSYGGTTTGTSSAYISAPAPQWTSYESGQLLVINPHVANAASATINVNSLGAKSIRRNGAAISASLFTAGSPVVLAYNGSQFDVVAIDVPAAPDPTPVGAIIMTAASTAPTGWLFCRGQEELIATYSNLSTAIGTTYNLGTETAGYFRLPDLSRRVPVGTGTSDTLGNTEGGNKAGTAYASRTTTHVHTVKKHYHGMGTGATLSVDISHSHTSSGGTITGTIGGSDGTHTHTITDPGHIHAIDRRASATAFGNAIAAAFPTTSGSLGTFNAVSNTTGITVNNSASSGHGHGHNLTASLGATGKTPTGTIGLVTGGENGNTDVDSGSSASPFIFINYIIKY